MGLQNCYLGFSQFWYFKKNIFQKLKKMKILKTFFVFKNFEKPVTHVLEHYVVHVHTKFQADIIFGSHLRALKRCWPLYRSMVPTHSDLSFGTTTSSTSFFFALASLSCEWMWILTKLLLCIYSNIFGIFQLRQLIKYTYLNAELTIFDLTSTR